MLYVSLREAAASHRELSLRPGALEEKTESLIVRLDVAARQTRVQFKQVFDALRELMAPPDPPRRSIGFVLPEEKRGTNQLVKKTRVRST